MKAIAGSILAILITTVFLPSTALAAPPLAPEFNPLCWHREECEGARSGFSQGRGESGWIEGDAPCDQPGWGKCLPAGETETTIAFGGQKNFKDMGELMVVLYNYAVRIAGLLAVIVIIVAGVQWVASGGSSEVISSAKKRIGGAIIGLMIAFASFVILNTINPNLVKFRLPRIWLVRSSRLMPEYCRQSPSSTEFALLGANGQAVTLDKFQNVKLAKVGFDSMKCGDQYAVAGGGTTICRGDMCDPRGGEVCAPYIISGGSYSKGYSCVPGQILIRFDLVAILDHFSQNNWFSRSTESDDWLDYSDVEVYGVCLNPTTKVLALGAASYSWGSGKSMVNLQSTDKTSNPWSYAVVYDGFTGPDMSHSDSDWKCPNGFNLDGFILRTEIFRDWSTFEPFLFIGQSVSGGAVYGSWPTVGIKNYIRKDKLGKSMVLFNISLTDSNIKDIFENKDNKPHYQNNAWWNPVGDQGWNTF